MDLPPVEEYQKYFLHYQNEQYIMESSPGYLYGGEEIAACIKKMLGEIKVLFLLREPAARFYSCYKFFNKIMMVNKMTF